MGKKMRIAAAGAVVAVLVALGGVIWGGSANAADVNPSGYGAAASLPADSVGYRELKAGSVGQKQLIPNAVSYDQMGPKSVWQKQIAPNVVDDSRLTASLRAKINAPDKVGLSGVHADAPYGANLPGQDSSSTAIPAGKTKVIWTACAAGEAALGGGFRLGDLANESFATGETVAYPDLQVIASEAAYYKDGALVNGSEVAPVNENQSFRPNAWAVTVHNAGEADSVTRAWVTCAKVG